MPAQPLCFAPALSPLPRPRAAHASQVHTQPAVRLRSRRARRACAAPPPRCAASAADRGDAAPQRDTPLLRGGDASTPPGSGNALGFVGADTLAISFTCDADACGERITKTVRRRSYEKGTVLIQCPRCRKHHIIADNYGMYAEVTGGRKNIEEIARASGTSFTRVGGDTFENALNKEVGDHGEDTEQTKSI